MFEKLDEMKNRYLEITNKLNQPEIVKDQDQYRTLMKESTSLQKIVSVYDQYLEKQKEFNETSELLEKESDDELKDMILEEQGELSNQKQELESQLTELLHEDDPMDNKNIIMEIRAGAGGDEAGLFANDLFRMYSRFAEENKWKIDIISLSQTGIGGIKEIFYSVDGKDVYKNLKYEMGVHRVQRIPATETGGRIHTSTITVAVLPEMEESEIDIDPKDLRIDVFRSSGPGGQSVNTTDSAVRITHLPTNLVVTCQDEKSQHKNKAKALKVLRARLHELEQKRIHSEQAEKRRSQVGTGDRAEKIRTYNYPQNRVTDHRIGLTLHNLDRIVDGDLNELINALKLRAREEQEKV